MDSHLERTDHPDDYTTECHCRARSKCSDCGSCPEHDEADWYSDTLDETARYCTDCATVRELVRCTGCERVSPVAESDMHGDPLCAGCALDVALTGAQAYCVHMRSSERHRAVLRAGLRAAMARVSEALSRVETIEAARAAGKRAA